MRWSRCIRFQATFGEAERGCGLDRHAAAWFPAFPARGSFASGLGNCFGRVGRQWHRKDVQEFNRLFDHNLIWVPWQRPGFELGMDDAQGSRERHPGCDGVILGGHGLFDSGAAHSGSKLHENTISIIDQLGQFVQDHVEKKGGNLFGGQVYEMLPRHRELALDLFPFLRGRVSAGRRRIGNFSDLPEVQRFVNAREAKATSSSVGHQLSRPFYSQPKVRGQSLPFINWQPGGGADSLKQRDQTQLFAAYQKEYAGLLPTMCRKRILPAMREASPAVVLIPGIGMFSFGKNKTEARLTGEFYVNAIHVMEGATSLNGGNLPKALPRRRAERPRRSSKSIPTMWPCRRRRHFELNIGRWKKQRSGGSLPRKS